MTPTPTDKQYHFTKEQIARHLSETTDDYENCIAQRGNQDDWMFASCARVYVGILLSLLNNQAAAGDTVSRNDVVARIEQQIRLWNDDTVTMACADMLADIKRLPSVDAATAMRNKCVEKVKGLIEQWAVPDSDLGDEVSGFRIDAANDIIEALEKLTLDQVKPGEK